MKNVIPAIACALFITIVTGCHKQPQGKIIAKVADETLTLDEALAHIDTSRKPVDDQIRRYMAQWVSDELINQEAKRKGVENDEQFQRRMQEAKRILTNQYFLEHNIYSDTTGINEHLMQEYFKNHSAEFFVQEEVIKMNVISFSVRERASSFAASVLRGTHWSDAVATVFSDTSSGVISNSIGKYYTQHTLFPVELWKVASTLGVNDVSFPVKTSIGYSVIQMISTMKRGEPADYTLVQDEIRERVLMEQRRGRYNELLKNLHKKYKVEIFLSTTTNSDSNKMVNHE